MLGLWFYLEIEFSVNNGENTWLRFLVSKILVMHVATSLEKKSSLAPYLIENLNSAGYVIFKRLMQ